MKTKWKLIGTYPVKEYVCGLRAGQRVWLRKDLVVTDPDGNVDPPIHSAGEIWQVIPGSVEPPIDVWFRRPDGERHTWADSDSIYEWFEVLDD